MGLLDALSYIGDAFDKPGRAVRGLLGGRPEELLAAVPFSDSLGLTDHANRVSGQDLTGWSDGSLESTVGNIGAEVATDPLMLAGGLLGKLLGKNAGKAAAARGPQYETTADDLAKMTGDFTTRNATLHDSVDNVSHRAADLMSDPQSRRLLSEVNPGSSILGAGGEGMAFKDPNGKVLRLGYESTGNAGRPIAEGVLPATSTTDIGRWRAERTPFAENVNDGAFWRTRNPETMTTQMDDLNQTLRNSGLHFEDRHIGNAGTLGGKPQVIDPGALDVSGFTGQRSPVTQAGDPSRLMGLLLDNTGANDAVRKAYASGLSGPNLSRKFGTYGAAAGADAGIMARLLGE